MGQRGRQRAILREGVYAINLALFVVICENMVYRLPSTGGGKRNAIASELAERTAAIDGFRPVVVGGPVEAQDPLDPEKTMAVDSIAIVTVHDGPSLPRARSSPRPSAPTPQRRELPQQLPGSRGVPAGRRPARPAICAAHRRHLFHQSLVRHGRDDPEDGRADRLRRRRRQLLRPARQGPVGDDFRHGEHVAEGERGVWERPLGPGKYPFNTYAGNIILVPTTNFVLHWITGKTEAHRYDESSSRSTW